MIDARNTFRKVNQTINDFSQEQLEGLTTIIKSYRGEEVDFTKNEWLTSTFESGSYENVEGLCKVASMDDIIDNDYSLTPGRYVGFSIQVDKKFNYKGRMHEINEELKKLALENESLTKILFGLKL